MRLSARVARHIALTMMWLAASTAAHALPQCELNGEVVDPANGHTTAGMSGVMRCTDDQGELRLREQTVRDGRFEGPVRLVLRDGTRKEYSVNERGNRHGVSREFDARGTLRREEHLVDGQAVGEQKQFAEAGHLERLEFFVERRLAVTLGLLADGSLSELRCAERSLLPLDRAPCGHDGPVSEITLFHAPGKPSGWVRYLAGQLQFHAVLDERGETVRTEEVKEGRRIKRVYYRSGQLRSEADFIERDPSASEGREGVAREWAEGGQLTQETQWASGQEKTIRQWYLNGRLKLHQEIQRDERHQQRHTESYWDNGQPAAINTDRDGRLLGWQKYFDEAGVLRREDEHGDRGVLLRRKQYGAQGALEKDERFLPDGSRV
jgi:antitoxin component YwqK of YwqJK toxin-antitoxin module